MIKYELAKKLKEAGFEFKKFNDNSKCNCLNCNSVISTFGEPYKWCQSCNREAIEIDNKLFLLPTLSELIEACGKYFSLAENTKGEWLAIKYKFIEDTKHFNTEEFSVGNSKEEAVANLWLKLNSSKQI
mgnify:CR=1 FL=1